MESVFLGWWFTISELTVEGQILQSQQGSRCQSIKIQKIKDMLKKCVDMCVVALIHKAIREDSTNKTTLGQDSKLTRA